MTNAINWFEIPVKNFDRAKGFYETLFAAKIEEMPHPSYQYGILPGDMQHGGITGGIVAGEGFEPSMNGPLSYLNEGEDLSVPLSKVVAAGGRILLANTPIGANGFMAHIVDTEGNKIALHSKH